MDNAQIWYNASRLVGKFDESALADDADFTKLEQVCRNKSDKSTLKYLINLPKFDAEFSKQKLFREINNALDNMKHIRTLGEVSLINVSTKVRNFSDEIKYAKKGTHRCGKPMDFGVILYNVEAVRYIHPVQDDVLFDATETECGLARALTCPISQLKPHEITHVKLGGLGRVDEFYFYYKALNYVTGYNVFCYGYNSHVPTEILLTEKELLQKKLPKIKNDIACLTSGSSSDITSFKVKHWSEFAEDFLRFVKHELNDSDKIYSDIDFINEDEDMALFGIVDVIFNENLFKAHTLENKRLRFRQDLGLCNKDNKIVVKMMFANGNEIGLDKSAKLAEYCLSNSSNNRNARQHVRHMYDHLKMTQITYGILTTFAQNWFFYLDSNPARNILKISPTVDSDEFLKAVYFFTKKHL